MNKISMSIILIIGLMGCVMAANGQSDAYAYMQPTETAGYAATAPSAAQSTDSQYSQYYTMPAGSAPTTHIIAPQKYVVEARMPAIVYLGNQMQAVQYSQYLSSSTYKSSNSFWIQGSTSWSQYAVVPQNAFLSLIATSSAGGNGYLYEIYPDGKISNNNFNFFPGANQIGFYADAIGQHTLLFSINGQASNTIVIDVVAYQPSTYQQPVYQQPIYYQQPVYKQPSYYQTPVYATSAFFSSICAPRTTVPCTPPKKPSHDNESSRDHDGERPPRDHGNASPRDH